MIRRTALRFAVIVRAATAGKKTEAVERAQLIRERIRQPLLEPADRPCAHAGKYDAGLPRLAKNFRYTPVAPDGEQGFRVSAADVDHILIEQERPQFRRPLEKRQNRWPASELQECRVET